VRVEDLAAMSQKKLRCLGKRKMASTAEIIEGNFIWIVQVVNPDIPGRE
jgi:hypothetical protein